MKLKNLILNWGLALSLTGTGLTACSPKNEPSNPKDQLPTEEVYNLDDLNISFSVAGSEVTLIDLQNLIQGQKKSVVVTIKNKATVSTPSLTATVGSKYYLTSSTCQAKILKSNESCVLTLNISANGKPVGLVTDTLFFGMASVPVQTNIVASSPAPTNNSSIVFYDGATALSSELDFSPVVNKFSRVITIKNEGTTESVLASASLNNSNFYLTSNSCSNKKLSCPTCQGINPPTCDLTVNYSPTGKTKGQTYSSILSFAGSSITLKATIPTNQTPTSDAILVFSDGSSDLSAPLHIGTYFNNATLSKIITVRNIGSGTSLPFTVSLTNNNLAWYAVSNSCANTRLISGASCSLNLRVSTSGKPSGDYSVVLSTGDLTQEVLFTRFLLLNCPANFHQEGAACVSDYRSCTNQDYLNNGVTLSNINSFEGQVYFEDYSSCLIQSCQAGYDRSGDQRACAIVNRACEAADALINGVNVSQAVNYQGNVLGTSVAACLVQSCNTGYAPAADRKSCYQNQFACLEADAISNGVSSSHVATYKGDKVDADVSACLINTCVAGYNPSGDFKTCEIINRSCLAIDAQGNGVNTSNVTAYKGSVLGTNNSSCLIQSCQAGYNISLNEKSCDLINRPCQQVDVISNGVNTNNSSTYKGNVIGTSLSACLIDECVAGYNPANDSRSCVQINRACLQADAVSNGVGTTNVSSYKGNVIGTSVAACLVNTCVAGYESALDGKSCVQINRVCTQSDVLANGVNVSNSASFKGSVVGTNNTSCLIQSCDAGYNVAVNEKSCIQVNRACLQADAVSNGVDILNVAAYKGNVVGVSTAACLVQSCNSGYSVASNEKSCQIVTRSCLQADAVSNGVSSTNVTSYKGNVVGTNVSACLANTCQSGYSTTSDFKSCLPQVRSCVASDAESNGVITDNVLSFAGQVLQGTSENYSNCLINSCTSGYSASLDKKTCQTSRACLNEDVVANGIDLSLAGKIKGSVVGASVESCLIDSCVFPFTVATDGRSCSYSGSSLFALKLGSTYVTKDPSVTLIFKNTHQEMSITFGSSCTASYQAFEQNYLYSFAAVKGDKTISVKVRNSGVESACETKGFTYRPDGPMFSDQPAANQVTNNYYQSPYFTFSGSVYNYNASGTIIGNTPYVYLGFNFAISTTTNVNDRIGKILSVTASQSAFHSSSGNDLQEWASNQSGLLSRNRVLGSNRNGVIQQRLQEGQTYYALFQLVDEGGATSTWISKAFTYVRKPSLYFTADNGVNGRELWQYDPAMGGQIKMIKDFSTGTELDQFNQPIPKSTKFLGLYTFNDKLYIFAEDVEASNQLSIWKYDYNSVTPLTKITTLAGVDNFNKVPIWTRNSKMWFPLSVSGTVRLYSSDGTSSGTVEETNTNVWSGGMRNFKFSADNNTLFFVADGGTSLYNVRLTDKALFFNGKFSQYLGDYSPLGTQVILYGTRSTNPIVIGLFKISSFTSQPTNGLNNNWTAYGGYTEALQMTVFGSHIYYVGHDYSNSVNVPGNSSDNNQPAQGYRKLFRTNGTTYERVISLSSNVSLGSNVYPGGIDNIGDLKVINNVLHFSGNDGRVLGGGTANNSEQFIRGFYKLEASGTTSTKLLDMDASFSGGASYREIVQMENSFYFLGAGTNPIKGSAIFTSGYSASQSGLNGTVYELFNGNGVGSKNFSPDNFTSY